MDFSKGFIRLNWIAVILIYLVVIAGSFVRITGSGMGCPDWPKCFSQWVPPTDASQLPENYQEHYLEGRVKKVEKFTRFLSSLGMKETAEKLKTDPNVYIEEPFNARKTWTEYVNRLAGFLAGNALLACFIWMLIRYRKRKILVLAGINLVLMGIQGWFGSIVVASNLVPWTITVHLFLALVIIGIQLYVLHLITPKIRSKISLSTTLKWIIIVCFLITSYQMFLGTQVREAIDELTKLGYGRNDWTAQLGLPFYIHRSFSWFVLALLVFAAWKNEKESKLNPIRWVFVILVIELLSGVLLAHFDMPGLMQTAHLVFATLLFGVMLVLLFRVKLMTK